MKPTLVVYGNCQSEVLASCFKFIPDLAEHYEVVYFRSFVHPTEGAAVIDPEIMSRCQVLWKQVDESAPFSFSGDLPAGCRVVGFPPVDLGLLWPFQTHDALFGPEPGYEYGMFPYGDRVLIETSQLGFSGDEGVRHAATLAAERTRDIERHVDIEFSRLMRREQGATVRLAPFVLSNFKVTRLFWSYNHPTGRLLAEILNRLIVATWPEARRPDHKLHATGTRIFASWEPLAGLQVPISSVVAEGLGLVWWNSSMTYKFHDQQELTQEEYYRLYIDERIQRIRVNAGTA